MERRAFLRSSGLVVAAGLSGCGGQSEQSESATTPTRSPTATVQPDPEVVGALVKHIDERTTEWGDEIEMDDLSTAFLETVKPDGAYTENGAAFVERLATIEASIGMEQAAMAAVSVAGFEAIADDDLTTIDRWLNSPESFQETAFLAGPEMGHDGIVGGLIDTSGDGLRDGFLLTVLPGGTNWWDEPAPAYAERVTDLQGNGYTQRALDYLEQLGRYWERRDNEYEHWAQADRQGLLADATEDGEVSETDLRGLRDDSDDRLINAQAEAFGVDPLLADTSGDGFLDHLAWLMSQEIDLPVVPTEPNVYVEVATAAGVDRLTHRETALVTELYAGAPGGPVNVHFYEGEDGVEPIEDETAMTDRADDIAHRRDLGYHFVLLNDDSLDFDGIDDRRGRNTGTDSWIDGSIESERARASVLAHELAHSFGISNDDFDGVDSEEYLIEEYDSVLNYNSDAELVRYNEGDPFDDWAHMRESQYGYDDLDVSGLEAAWEAGVG